MSRLYKTDTNAVVRFYETALKNNFQSEKAGKPVFDTAVMAEVITPGQSASTLEVIIERKLTVPDNDGKEVIRTRYYHQFQKQYEAFKADSDQYSDTGMPIRNWAQIDRGTAETLAAQGVHTVEALASVSDSALQNLGTGARSLREKAQQYILSREFGVPSAQLSAEVTLLKEEVERLTTELSAANTKIAEMEAAASAKPAKAKAAAPAPAVV